MTDLEICKKMMSLATSAGSRNIPFDLSFRKLKYLLKQKTCYFTKNIFDDTDQGRRSIDRLDPNKGYTDDNVVATTVRINGLRSNITPIEIKQMYLRMKNRKMI